MLISALTDYYDILAKNGKLLKEGYSNVSVGYLICLSMEGKIVDIIPHRREVVDEKGKSKFLVKKEVFPKRIETTTIKANVIDNRPLYIFGISCHKGCFMVDNKAQKSHESFVIEQTVFLEGIKKTPLVIAFENFVNSWNPNQECENPKLLKISKDYASQGYSFCLDGHPEILLNELPEVCEKWEFVSDAINTETNDCEIAQCAISGKMAKIARLHNNLKGIQGGQMSGVNIVCYKENAYESYGKEQSFNSNISEEAMTKYTTAFNYLTLDSYHKVIIDGMTVLFWSDDAKGDEKEVDIFNSFAFGDNKVNANQMDNELFNAIKSLKRGIPISDIEALDIDEKMKFYILGVMPNASRLAIKFFYQNSFENILKNCIQHQIDFSVEDGDKAVALWQIFKQLTSPKSMNDKIQADLSTKILDSVLLGTEYPIELLHKVVQRIKTDSDEEKNQFIKINKIRISIIKAYINRKLRLQGKKEEFTMSLNEENTSQAYLCGRLFAVLEKIQKDASGGTLNKTIKDSYFSSACSTPSTVFPRLIKLSQFHLAKLTESSRKYYNSTIGSIIEGLLNSFPSTLVLDAQGEFIVGYYQQNKALYTSNIKENTEE